MSSLLKKEYPVRLQSIPFMIGSGYCLCNTTLFNSLTKSLTTHRVVLSFLGVTNLAEPHLLEPVGDKTWLTLLLVRANACTTHIINSVWGEDKDAQFALGGPRGDLSHICQKIYLSWRWQSTQYTSGPQTQTHLFFSLPQIASNDFHQRYRNWS